jgi:uncharacterized protein (DUF952 family)
VRIFHIVDGGTWAAAEKAGEYRPDSLLNEGFVHFSFAEQVEATAQRYYAGVTDLVLVEFDSETLRRSGVEVVVEDLAGHGEYPHVYAAIPTTAAIGVRPLLG